MENLVIQYPTNSAEMTIPANTTIKPVDKRINRKLFFLTVSVPEDCVMYVLNNNVQRLYFANENRTLAFPDGLSFEDMIIYVINTGEEAAAVKYTLIFG